MNDIFGGGISDSVGISTSNQGNVVYGLNKGKIVSISFNTKAGKDGADGNAVMLKMSISGAEKDYRYFLPDKIFKDNAEITDKDSQEYKDGIEQETTNFVALVIHLLKAAGMTQEQIASKATNGGIATNLVDYCKKMFSGIPEELNADVEAFMQYQYVIGKKQKKTYLELPKNLKHGFFLIKATGKNWEESRDAEGGLIYINGSEEHPFTRSSWFMSSNFSKQQGAEVKEEETPFAFANKEDDSADMVWGNKED